MARDNVPNGRSLSLLVDTRPAPHDIVFRGLQQLAGFVRTMSDDPEVSDDSADLEVLAGIAHHCDLADGDLRARLVRLHDSATLYLTAGLISYGRRLESRAEDAETFMDEPTLLLDARHALECCVGLLEPSA